MPRVAVLVFGVILLLTIATIVDGASKGKKGGNAEGKDTRTLYAILGVEKDASAAGRSARTTAAPEHDLVCVGSGVMYVPMNVYQKSRKRTVRWR